MKSRSLLVCLLLAVPALAPGASKEIMELQRDVALLQQQIKDLQRSQDEKFAALLELVQQSVDAANNANTSVAVIASTIEKNLRDQTDKVVTPVVGLSTRLNEMGGDLRTLTPGGVSDLTARLNRMQAQLTDVSNAIKVIQQPPVAPPRATRTGRRPRLPLPTCPRCRRRPCTTQPRQDYVSGKYDLASQEFADYLRYYGTTGFAPNAQFYIAMIHFVQQGNYDTAVKEFDMVLEKYPDNNKTADALLYKGRALVKMPGHKTEGADEFMEVIRRFPKSDQSVQACTERKALGLNCGAPASSTKASAKRKK